MCAKNNTKIITKNNNKSYKNNKKSYKNNKKCYKSNNNYRAKKLNGTKIKKSNIFVVDFHCNKLLLF